MRRIGPFLLAATLLALSPQARGGKLDQMRDTVHGDEQEEDSSDEASSSDDIESYDDSDDVSVLAELALWMLEAALETESAEIAPGTLARRDPNRSDLQLSSEYEYDLDGVHRPALSARWYPVAHVGIDTTVAHYLELDQRSLDQLLLGDANLLFRWWPDPALSIRLGAGAIWLYDRPRVDVGFNLTSGAELLLWPQVILCARGDVSGIGEAMVLHGRASLGYRLAAAELYLGYDVRGFYSGQGGVLFHGPVGGLRGWF